MLRVCHGTGEDVRATDNLSGFVSLEKYDGVRARWDPSKQRFIKRSGGLIKPVGSQGLHTLPVHTLPPLATASLHLLFTVVRMHGAWYRLGA